jgi:hypothetical protein
VWNSSQGPVNVTLMLHKQQMASQIICQQSVQPQSLSLNAITEFCDLVPKQHFGEEGDDLVQGDYQYYLINLLQNCIDAKIIEIIKTIWDVVGNLPACMHETHLLFLPTSINLTGGSNPTYFINRQIATILLKWLFQ